MKTLETIQRFSRLGRTLSRTAFILAVVGFCGCVLGLFSLALGSDGVMRWGGVTIHGVLAGVEELGSVRAALVGWLILCAGEAVLAKLAERYFRNELTAGTPFTLAGAGELRRLGILSLVLPAGCAAAACMVEGIVAGFSGGAQEIAGDLWQDGGVGIALGVMFLALSLLCRYGAERAGEFPEGTLSL